MHGFHECDIGQHGLLMQRHRIRQHGYRAHSALDGIQQRQTGKDPHCGLFFQFIEGAPAFQVVRDRHLFRQPEVTGEPIPHFQVFFVGNGVPIDCVHWFLVGG